MRITLSETVVDLSSALDSTPELADQLHISSARFDLPIEVAMSGTTLFVNVPRWRWRTDFDEQPGHLRMGLIAVAPGVDDADI